VEWIRSPRKSVSNCSIGWKDLVFNFPLMGGSIVWRVRNGRRIRVGEDPWEGSEGAHNLSKALVEKINNDDISSLWDVAS
jgi:hypothetical protein